MNVDDSYVEVPTTTSTQEAMAKEDHYHPLAVESLETDTLTGTEAPAAPKAPNLSAPTVVGPS